MIFTKTEIACSDLLILKSDEIEITVASDGVYLEGIGAPDEHVGHIKNYQDLQMFAKALGDAWKYFEERQAMKRIQIAKTMPPLMPTPPGDML